MTLHSMRRAVQRGFVLTELIIALSIIAILALYASARAARDSEDVLAKGSGAYLQTVASAAQNHVLVNFNSYANNTPVVGVAVLLQPTVAELVNLGRLNAGFPSGPGSLPTRQTARIDITRLNCPGAGCSVTAMVCTTTPVTLGGTFTRFDLASEMVAVQNGTGGQSLQNQGSIIRGPVLNQPNPNGNVEGITCGSGMVDVGMYSNFLVMNDSRDPNFQGPLTVAGPTVVKSTLQAGTTTVGTCATILATTGRAGFGCANPNDVPAGYTGGVRSPDVVANGAVLATASPSTFTGNNAPFAYMGVNGGVGEVRTSGRAQADRLVPAGAYGIGTACAVADEGAIARDSAGSGLVTCRTGLWRSMSAFAAAGAACSPEGAFADDGTGAKMLCRGGIYRPLTNMFAAGTPGAACANPGTSAYDFANAQELLLCRPNPAGGGARYMRLRDVTSNLVFVQSYEVIDVSQGAAGNVTKPTCAPATGMSGTALIQLIPKIYSTPDGGVAAYAVDGGSVWQIYLRSGTNSVLSGNPSARAIANTYCYFA